MNHEVVSDLLLRIGDAVCDHVYQSLQEKKLEELSSIVEESNEDTIYAIDKEVEHIIVPFIEQAAEDLGGIVLIAEGLGDESGKTTFPIGLAPGDAAICIIMDPIDGTRGIMYNKRSAFFLAGAAANHHRQIHLQDIEVAVMTELPTSKVFLSDSFFAIKNQGAKGFQRNLFNNTKLPLNFRPSSAASIIGGFGQIARFFPPGKEILAKIEEDLIAEISEIKEGKALIFEDQYISSGGQLYELLMGHDRFTADLRPPLYASLKSKGITSGLTCHPYDVCATLIGEEAGLIITDINGDRLDVPLDLTTPVCWIGYANKDIQKQVEPILQKLLRNINWIKSYE